MASLKGSEAREITMDEIRWPLADKHPRQGGVTSSSP
jgi:hypothetical protein